MCGICFIAADFFAISTIPWALRCDSQHYYNVCWEYFRRGLNFAFCVSLSFAFFIVDIYVAVTWKLCVVVCVIKSWHTLELINWILNVVVMVTDRFWVWDLFCWFVWWLLAAASPPARRKISAASTFLWTWRCDHDYQISWSIRILQVCLHRNLKLFWSMLVC